MSSPWAFQTYRLGFWLRSARNAMIGVGQLAQLEAETVAQEGGVLAPGEYGLQIVDGAYST
jgi:hypothetical protein